LFINAELENIILLIKAKYVANIEPFSVSASKKVTFFARNIPLINHKLHNV